MIRKSESEIRAEYGDLLETEDDPVGVRLAQLLDAGYGMNRAPAALRSSAHLAWEKHNATAGYASAVPVRRSWLRRAWVPALAVILLLVIAGVALALSNVTNLGGPANIESTNAYFPLSGFHRMKGGVHQSGKPVLLFVGSQGPSLQSINAERWPVVKALDQFGTLSGVSPVERQCTTVPNGMFKGQTACTIPTFDLSQARYRSRYLVFVSRDLLREERGRLVPFQRLSPAEQALFDRYARASHPQCGSGTGQHFARHPCSYVEMVQATIAPQQIGSQRTLPLIVTGGYEQTVSQDLGWPDFAHPIAYTPPPGRIVYAENDQRLPFETVHQALLHGKDPPASHLVEDVNAEANVITALICHADGRQPVSICGRPAIRAILKYVK